MTTSGIADDRLRVAANRFYEFRVKLKHLDSMLRAHLNDLKRAAASRASVIHALAKVSQESPILELVGSSSTNNDSTTSYATTALRDQQTSVQLDRYEREIVSYVTEWEKTVSTRVATELKHIANLHNKWTKYHQKVEQLKASAQKKKHPSSDLEDKITWNESKLRTAKKEYRRNLIAVTLLTEEVTDRGWKDLIPLMIRLIDYDVHATKTAAGLLAQLNHVREEMVELGRRYEMDFEAIRSGRLRVLLEEDATDFVDPSDLQDLESTIASIEGRGSNKRTPTRAPYTPPCSDMDEASQDGEKREEICGEKEEQQKEIADAFDETSCAVPDYPSSIYLVDQEGGTSPVDDETTLTGVQDLVSV